MVNNDIRQNFFSQLKEPFTGVLLFDQLSDIVFFIKNARGQYIIVNQTLLKRLGFKSKAQVIGHRADELYPEPLGAEYRKQDEEIISGDKPILNQLELQLNNAGQKEWCLTTKVPLHGPNGEVVGLAGISRDLQIPDKKNKDFPLIAEALAHIKVNFAKSIKIQQLAEIASLSVYQFEKRMQTIFNLTAGQFIQKTRIDASLWKLTNTEESIVNIALGCGYADQSSFSRQFKQSVGISPAQYRRLAK
ncbi:MAG: AraC family transcriptional regulator [Phycisphaerae bacterium]|nr:AraC family transcriptional regulator [Phycisphaerae bacterium]